MKRFYFISLFTLTLGIVLNSSASDKTLTLQIKRPNHSILLRAKKDILEFRPNASLHWGFKLSSNAFYFEYGGKIKDTNYGNSQVGNNSYKNFRVGVPIANTYTVLSYQEWIGFSSDENNENGCEYCLDRPNLSSRDRGAQFTYALNKDFSMKALNSNGSSGVSFSTSILISMFYNRLKYRDFNGLLQGQSNNRFPFFARLSSLEMSQYGAGIGYALLAPLYQSLYLGFSAVLGGGYQQTEQEALIGNVTSENSFGTHWSIKAMFASKGPGLNLGLKGYLLSNIYSVSDSNSAASLSYSLYAYTSYSW